MKPPGHFQASPLTGHVPLERDILLYFRGDVGQGREARYSRGIRQKLFQLAHEGKWWAWALCFARARARVLCSAQSVPAQVQL